MIIISPSSSTRTASPVVASTSDLDPTLGRLNITTESVVRPRSECQAGSDQLKLGHKTKTPLTEEQRRERAVGRFKSKVGEDISEELKNKWKEIHLNPNRK